MVFLRSLLLQIDLLMPMPAMDMSTRLVSRAVADTEAER